jgi:hypothetical protein
VNGQQQRVATVKPGFEWVYTPRSVPRQSAQDTASSPRSTVISNRIDQAFEAAPAAGSSAISDRIERAFDTASTTTGTSFEYLVKTAQRESAMNPAAKARTSSATGLFQFIESTWLETMKIDGPALGLSRYADQIEVSKGRYRVTDPEARAEILALREDPEIASLMAGALTRRNATYLQDRIGRVPNAGELYIAHFMGAHGAASLIELATARPDASAAAHFPRHASANRSIFYEKGEELTVAAVYADLVSKHGGTGVAVDPSAAVIAAYAPAGSAAAEQVFAAAAADDANGTRVDAGWKAAASNDPFTALFRTDGARSVAAATPAPSFWQGYAVAPALFDVAVAEDMKAIAALDSDDEKRRRASITALARDAASGPLDLSRFLDTDDT